MKAVVLEFFKTTHINPEARFNKALEMYRKSPTKNPAQERFLNAAGYSPVNLENLLYDLKQLHNISDADIRMAQTSQKPKLVVLFEDIKNKTTEELVAFLLQEKVELPEFNIPDNYNELKAYVKEHDIKSASLKKEDLNTAILNDFEATIARIAVEYLEPVIKGKEPDRGITITVVAETKEEVFTKAPDEVKEAVKLREEFPFLNDPACPDELYILVGKKLAHYDAYVKAHEALFVNIVENADVSEAKEINMSSEEISALALSAVENFEANQAIYKELDYFKQNGKILGEHPIFKERLLKSSIDVMSVPDATKRLSNLDNYIRRDSKALEKAKTPETKEKLQKKIEAWKIELSLIKAKLGFSDK
ncbi:hypothetical protein [Lutibacter sp.]|uniref:hypothetical protein n=1 Tax=Lutibacter sp. TaxID=1925666 RepID=UPI0035616C87